MIESFCGNPPAVVPVNEETMIWNYLQELTFDLDLNFRSLWTKTN